MTVFIPSIGPDGAVTGRYWAERITGNGLRCYCKQTAQTIVIYQKAVLDSYQEVSRKPSCWNHTPKGEVK